MIYAFRCPECGQQFEQTELQPPAHCESGHDRVETKRDYRAEAVSVDLGGLREAHP